MKKISTLLLLLILFVAKSQNYSNVTSYAIGGTPVNGIKIKTNLPFSEAAMPTIIIEGFAYGGQKTIGLIINYYVYQNNFYSASSITSFGSYLPTVKLAQENGKVVIFLDDRTYFMRFSVRASGIESPSFYTGWSTSDEPITGSNVYPLVYKNSLGITAENDNIGIGTTSPSHKLHVVGDVFSSGQLISQTNSIEGGSIQLFNGLKTGINANKWIIYNMTGGYGNSLQFWNYSADGSKYGSKMKISDDGDMALFGKLEAKEIKVTTTPTADFVFAENYKLPTLEQVEKQIKENKHLPEISSAKEMEKEGVNVGQFQIKLLQKIEELTLYSIEQNKKLNDQNKKIIEQDKKNSALQVRLEKIEKLLSEKNIQ